MIATMREWIACAALSGFLSRYGVFDEQIGTEKMAEYAVECADLLLRELTKV